MGAAACLAWASIGCHQHEMTPCSPTAIISTRVNCAHLCTSCCRRLCSTPQRTPLSARSPRNRLCPVLLLSGQGQHH